MNSVFPLRALAAQKMPQVHNFRRCHAAENRPFMQGAARPIRRTHSLRDKTSIRCAYPCCMHEHSLSRLQCSFYCRLTFTRGTGEVSIWQQQACEKFKILNISVIFTHVSGIFGWRLTNHPCQLIALCINIFNFTYPLEHLHTAGSAIEASFQMGVLKALLSTGELVA
ncbi:MAG: hypothetical protein ACJAY6_002974 [Yoonia sp.]